MAVTLSGMKAGSSLMLNRAGTLLSSKENRDSRRSEALRKQATNFTHELSALKGSYVKIGQMLALFGEHILPQELTDALHQLDHQTTPVAWSIVNKVIQNELGELTEELLIDENPIAAASLGQVHRATIKQTGEQLCLKVLYPGVQNSIDSDFNDVIRIMKLARWLDSDNDLDGWLDELRQLLHQEVDYFAEAQRTRQMQNLLENDDRYVVPTVYDRYSTGMVLALEYLQGYAVTERPVQALAQERRTALAESMLELFFNEVFSWGILQTDPNFGNYRIRTAEQGGQAQVPEKTQKKDQLILLDFGAVRDYRGSFLQPLKNIIMAAHYHDNNGVIDGLVALGCIRVSDPDSVKQEFASFCMLLLEPMRDNFDGVPDNVINTNGEYRWRESRLVKRAGKQAINSALSQYFILPPREFSLIVRKLIGVFSFISVIGGEFNGYPLIERYAENHSTNG